VWTPREDVDGNLMFCLWCFNPALVFAPLAKQARCVVVTSGTLSPMQSFQGELGVPFPIKLEAPHIIPARQVFVQSFGGMGDLTNKVRPLSMREEGPFLIVRPTRDGCFRQVECRASCRGSYSARSNGHSTRRSSHRSPQHRSSGALGVGGLVTFGVFSQA
jgi:hypothetical protein